MNQELSSVFEVDAWKQWRHLTAWPIPTISSTKSSGWSSKAAMNAARGISSTMQISWGWDGWEYPQPVTRWLSVTRPTLPPTLARTTALRRFTKPKMANSPKLSPEWTWRSVRKIVRDWWLMYRCRKMGRYRLQGVNNHIRAAQNIAK